MVFSSFQFLFFFLPFYFLIYTLLPSTRLRNIWILVASFIFYAWGEKQYTLVLIISILLTWIFGILLASKKDYRWKTSALTLGIICNLILLIYYKYAGFLISQYLGITEFLGIKSSFVEESIHLPIGISFFTFQAISYLIDLYRGEVNCQYNPLMLAMYKSLFPQLISGPIVRYSQIQNDLYNRPFTLANFHEGSYRFAVGLIQKVLLANQVGSIADQIFSAKIVGLETVLAWLGVLAYTLQIYFDFAGYSNMAIGLAKIMGFSFPENFNKPYTATSITDFWRRWHISLSSWFRDYLYIPLGGNRCSRLRNYFNLIIVFLLCGFWHGAKWNFVIWGAIHGSFLCFEKAGLLQILNTLPRWCRNIYAFFVVMIGWVFFRADTLNDGVNFLKKMFGLSVESKIDSPFSPSLYDLLTYENIVFLIVALFIAFDLQSLFSKEEGKISFSMEVIRGLTVCFLFILSLMYLAGGTFNPFIYFRF